MRQQIFGHDSSFLKVDINNPGPYLFPLESHEDQHVVDGLLLVRVVRTYKHLGCQDMDSGSFTHEFQQRAASAKAAYRPIAAKCLAVPQIPRHARVNLSNSLVHSRLFLYSGIWEARFNKELFVISKVYHQVARTIARKHGREANPWTNDEVLHFLRIPP